VAAPKPNEEKKQKKGFFGGLVDAAKSFGEGVVDSVKETVVGVKDTVVGVAKFTASAAVCLTTPPEKRPEWAVEGVQAPVRALEGIKDGIAAVVQDPVGTFNGVAKMVKQTIEEKGVAYLLGRAAPDILSTIFTGGGCVALKATSMASKTVKALDKADDLIDGIKTVNKAGALAKGSDKVADTLKVMEAASDMSKKTNAIDKVDAMSDLVKTTAKGGGLPTKDMDQVTDLAKVTKSEGNKIKTAANAKDGTKAAANVENKVDEAADILKKADNKADPTVRKNNNSKAHDSENGLAVTNLPEQNENIIDKMKEFFKKEDIEEPPVKKIEPPKPSKDIAEAEQYARDVLGIGNVNYRGIAPEVADEWNRGLQEAFEKFPKLKKKMNFTGESHARIEQLEMIIRKYNFDHIRKNSKNAGIGDDELRKIADEQTESLIKKIQVNEDSIASSMTGGARYQSEVLGVTINERFGRDFEYMNKILKEQVESKVHPEGCDTIKSVLDHEIGHQLDALLGINEKDEIKKIFNNNKDNMRELLSDYAINNNSKPYKEMIAEAWAEYCNNPNPREIANEVGQIIEHAYKKKYKK
jgi:hypothetical protein